MDSLEQDDESPIIRTLEGKVVAGRYRVVRQLGEGGMGTVYLAEHITIEKLVALKVLLHEYARRKELRDRFLQEARAAARINHENIVDITDFGKTPDGSVFFAMEYLEGKDLSEVIRKGPLLWSRAKPIVLQICRALGAAHAKGIIHRDMKPENIHLIDREGRTDFAKLLDFGIAKMSEQGEKRLTRTGMIFGTPEYMSPEQAQGNKPDHRVDIYAVGVIMYEMLTGEVPFKADTFMGILTKHIFENPIPPSQINPGAGIPLDVEEIILKAMSKDPNDRFQSMTEMAATVARASGRMTRPTGDQSGLPPRRISSPSQTYAPSSAPISDDSVDYAPEPKRRLPLMIGLGVLAVLVGVGVAVLLSKNKNKTEKPVVQPIKTPVSTTKKIAPPKKNRVTVTLISDPKGAQIYKGVYEAGKPPIGTTPKTLTFEKGEKALLFTMRKKRFRLRSITVTPDKNKEVSTALIPLPKMVKRRIRRDLKRPKPKTVPPKTLKPKPKKKRKLEELMNPFD